MFQQFAYKHVDGWCAAAPREDTPGIAVDSKGQIYLLARTEEDAVSVFDAEGRFVCSWGKGLFVRAHGLCIGPDDSVYCIDDRGHSLRKFTSEGKLLMEVETKDSPADTGYQPGVPGSVKRAGSPFNTPTGVALTPEGDIIVSDGYGNARIHRFDERGNLKHSFGEPGAGAGQFLLPHGIAIDADGRLYVADREGNRVQVFTPEGTHLADWDAAMPSSISIGPDQTVYVCEMGQIVQGPIGGKYLKPENRPPRISIRNLEGVVLHEILPPDPDGEGMYFSPHSIALDAKGNIYVSEVSTSYTGGLAPANRIRLHKFERKESTQTTEPSA